MSLPRLAWIFVDAFAHRYLEDGYFPSLTESAKDCSIAKFRPLLGYSHAIIPSILTGRGPAETGVWNIYQFAPEESPFRFVSRIPMLPYLDSQPILRYAANRIITYLTGRDTANVPLRLLPRLTVGREHNLFLDDGFSGVKSLITEAKDSGFRVSVHGYPRHHHDRQALESFSQRIGSDDFIVCYLTGLDKAGHTLGPESPSMRKYCARFDRVVAKLMNSVRNHGYTVLLSSDHGMTTVSRNLNLPKVLGGLAKTVTYFADSTMARFYDESDARLREVRNALDSLGVGATYNLGEMVSRGLGFQHRRFGDLFYVCEPGTVLIPSSFSVITSNVRGMHGYDPDTPTESGVVISDMGTTGKGNLSFGELHDAIAEFTSRSAGVRR